MQRTSADPRTAAPLQRRTPAPDPPRVLVRTWLLAVGGLALAKLLSYVEPSGLLAGNLAGVAAFLFIALPDGRLRARHDPWAAYGVPRLAPRDPATWRALGRGALQGLLVCAVVFPVFAALFWLYAEALPHLPGAIARIVAPYGIAPRLSARLPERVLLLVVVQFLVVAAPEELFYRGWMQTSWARSAPERGVTVLGARLGAGFLWTQALFALGHLVVLEPWRLATFLPGLLFGWVRERTGGLVAPVVVHALANVFLATLEASFYG
ncbi:MULTISPECIES: myxosortase MrtX [unclassified Anaeromyxobacter]|uniref:myxosortase MrtX n=1 Tax=unclassified Anaeromyxobacter TaxID=2620896 RepID=UPI001F56C24A|nr:MULTISPECIES: MXAN_2755 family glutamic-type intramembrane protease [unclassified Anaeromyxobacter]